MDPLAFLSPANIATYLIASNFIAFAAFGVDKMLAEAGVRRISEATLLQLAFIGGTPGAYAGRQLFRHKTSKQPFSGNLHNIAMIQIVALAGLGTWILTG
jgi:uncharacterized membrane protein YsdA (DUF1294 family)